MDVAFLLVHSSSIFNVTISMLSLSPSAFVLEQQAKRVAFASPKPVDPMRTPATVGALVLGDNRFVDEESRASRVSLLVVIRNEKCSRCYRRSRLRLFYWFCLFLFVWDRICSER